MHDLETIVTSFAKKPAHLLNPLRFLGVQGALDESYADITRGLRFAKAAADPVFLAVPQGMPAEQAASAGTRWTWHFDSAAGAVAHLNRAKSALKPFKTARIEEGFKLEAAKIGVGISGQAFLSLPQLPQRNRCRRTFEYHRKSQYPENQKLKTSEFI